MTNPLKELRLERGWTQEDLAGFAGVTRHAVLRTEQGVYALPPPAILSVFQQRTELSMLTMERQYVDWVKWTRRHTGLKLSSKASKQAVSVMSGPEFLTWRYGLGITRRMEFCRLFCVHPAVVEKYEKGQQHKMPDQLREALFDAGMLSHNDY
jgi:DNA-binding transcriptional regulator YiaG